MTQPLSGITILDLTHVLAGPFCSMTLADLGAKVIKVERPGTGDDTRAFPPFANGKSAYFAAINHGKKSIALDLKTDDDRALIWFRPYEPPPEVPDDGYPFWLCTGRVLEHWHTGSMTRRIPQLHRAMPEAYVELNRSDATRLGINRGDTVRVVSRRGAIELPAEVDGRGKPPAGSTFIPFFDESHLINFVTLDACDNISKQPDYKKCAVRIERV